MHAQVYGFTAEQMSIITLVLSFIALLPPAIAAVLSRYMADREIMTLGLVLKTLGVLFTLAPTSEYSRAGRWLFIIGRASPSPPHATAPEPVISARRQMQRRVGGAVFVRYVCVVKASLFFLMSGTSNLTKQLGDQANRAPPLPPCLPVLAAGAVGRERSRLRRRWRRPLPRRCGPSAGAIARSAKHELQRDEPQLRQLLGHAGGWAVHSRVVPHLGARAPRHTPCQPAPRTARDVQAGARCVAPAGRATAPRRGRGGRHGW